MLFGNLPLNGLTELNIFKAEAASDSVEKIDVTEFNKYGKMLFSDPFFYYQNNGVTKYSNLTENDIILNKVDAPSDCPVATNYVLEVETVGQTNLGCGGIKQWYECVKGGVYYQILVAKIPVGFSIHETHNAIGYQAQKTWLTSQKGTGKWETYIVKYECGLDFGQAQWGANFGHIYLTYDSEPGTCHNVKWQIAYAEIFDATGEKNNVVDSNDGLDISWTQQGSVSNGGLWIYNNKSNGAVTKENITVQESPFYGSKEVIKFTSLGNTTPGLGGFCISVIPKRGYTYYHKFLAKIPVGYRAENYSNTMDASTRWITSQEGTGDWQTYIYKVDVSPHAVNLGDFGYVALVPDGLSKFSEYTTTSPVTWYLGYSNTYRTIESPDFPYAEHYYVGNAYYDNHSYISFNYKTTWTEARDICYKLGGHLATITSAEEQSAVQALVNGTGIRYYLGASDSEQEGTWKWITGEPFSYTAWNSGEPSNSGGYEDYLEIFEGGTSWNDIKIHRDYSDGFICEFDSTAYVPAKTMVWNGHTYTLFNASLTWKNAKTVCENLGGHLVTITSQAEQTAIRDFVCGQAKGLYWMGATDEVNESRWAWVTGEPFDYTYWGDGEPSGTSANVENYGQIFSRPKSTKSIASWNDDNNSGGGDFYSLGNVGFICEIENADSTPAKVLDSGNNRYLRIDSVQPWSSAAEIAKLSGGHLVTITSQEEQNTVYNLISDGSLYYWGGGYSPKQNGEWEWVTGEPFEYTNWCSGEPNNTNYTEYYLQFYRDNNQGGWNDNSCQGGLGFIIELDNVRGSKDDYSWSYDGNTLTVSGSGDISGIEAEINADWFPMIKNVVINSDDITLSADTFKETDWYKSLPDGIIYVGSILYGYKGTVESDTDLVIVDGTTAVADKAFENQNGIISVSVPGTVKSIGENSFNGCSNISAVSGSRNSDAEELAEKLGVQFNAFSITVVFNPEGGTLETESVEIEQNTALTDIPVPQKKGYEFLGWFTEEEGGTLVDGSYNIPSDCELYAHWKQVSKFSIASQPDKTEYNIGDSLDPAGMTFTVLYSDGTSSVIGAENVMFSQNQFTTAGRKLIVANYAGLKATFYVQVSDGILTSLSVLTMPEKIQYLVGDELDLTGLVLTAEFDNGLTKQVTEGYSAECDLSSVGNKTVSVSYTQNGFTVTASFEITVAENTQAITPRIYSDDLSVYSGNTVSVPVMIENNSGFMGINIGLTYDAEKLVPVSVTCGSILSGGTVNDSIGYSEDGFINVVYFGSSDVSGNGELFTVDFLARSETDISTAIELSYESDDTFDENWSGVNIQCDEINVSISTDNPENGAMLYFGKERLDSAGTITVPVSIDSVDDISSINFGIKYDSSVLSPISVNGINVNSDEISNSVLPNAGIIELSWSGNPINNNISFAEIVFNVIGNKTKSTDLYFMSARLVKSTGDDQPLTALSKELIIADLDFSGTHIYSESIDCYAGETVEIPLYIGNNTGIMGIGLQIEYDEDVLTPVSAVAGNIFSIGSFADNIGINNGSYKLIWFGNSNNIENGLFATLKFNVSETADTGLIPINVSVIADDTFNEGWNTVEIETNDVSISVLLPEIRSSSDSFEIARSENVILKAGLNGSDKIIPDIIWSVSDDSVAEINSDGEFIGKLLGTVTVFADSADGFYHAEAMVTVTANSYTATWVVGNKTFNTSVVEGDELIPVFASMKNYNFKGWSPDIPKSMPSNDVTFYAVFEAIEYTASFVIDETVISTQKYTVETESLNEPDIPSVPYKLNARWSYYNLSNGEDITITPYYEEPTTYLPANITVYLNETKLLIPSCNYKIERKEWRSENADIVSVDSNGYITAMAEGECSVYVICYGKDELGNTINSYDSVSIVSTNKSEAKSFKEWFRREFDNFFKYKLKDFINNFVKAFVLYLLPFLH